MHACLVIPAGLCALVHYNFALTSELCMLVSYCSFVAEYGEVQNILLLLHYFLDREPI